VKNENFTLKVNNVNLTLDNCKPKEDEIYSKSKYCQKYEFIHDVDASANPNQIYSATAWPKDGTLPCPLIGFDIGCDSMNLPGEVLPGSGLCDNDCFLGPLSWEQCGEFDIRNIIFKVPVIF
jgi:hypothetical protein